MPDIPQLCACSEVRASRDALSPMARQVADAHRAEEAATHAQIEAAQLSSQVHALQASCSDYAHSSAAQADKLNQASAALFLITTHVLNAAQSDNLNLKIFWCGAHWQVAQWNLSKAGMFGSRVQAVALAKTPTSKLCCR